MKRGTVIIEGQRIDLDKVIGYTKINNEVLLFNTHGGMGQTGDEAGIFIRFDSSETLMKSLTKLDDIFNVKYLLD